MILAASVAALLGIIAGTWKVRQATESVNDARPVVEKTAEAKAENTDDSVAKAIVAVPAFSNEAERERTRAQRQAVMPIFLKAADEGIRQVRRDLETAKYRGAPAAEITTLENRLNTMERVRGEVVARNSDIDIRDYKY